MGTRENESKSLAKRATPWETESVSSLRFQRCVRIPCYDNHEYEQFCLGTIPRCLFLYLNSIYHMSFSLSHVWLFVTPWTAALQASLSFPISQSLLKLMSIESMMPSSHLILYHSLLLLPSIFPNISVFSSESVLQIRWPKYWSFSFSISLPMNIQGWFPLGLTVLIALRSKGLSRVFSSTRIQKYQFFGTQPYLWSNSHICIWLLEK